MAILLAGNKLSIPSKHSSLLNKLKKITREVCKWNQGHHWRPGIMALAKLLLDLALWAFQSTTSRSSPLDVCYAVCVDLEHLQRRQLALDTQHFEQPLVAVSLDLLEYSSQQCRPPRLTLD